MQKNILIVGCGDVGCQTGVRLKALGYGVYGIKRSVDANVPFPYFCADVSDLESLKQCIGQVPADIHYVLYAVAPAERSENAYDAAYPVGVRNTLKCIDVQMIEGFILVTSTAVYHQNQGEWVDESSETLPTTFSGKKLLQAEDILVKSAVKGVAVRLGGIYGPGRERLIKKVRKGCELNKNTPMYTNRIHRDDCAGLLSYIIQQIDNGSEVADCYIGVDSHPVSEWDVLCAIAGMLDVDSPVHCEDSKVRHQNKRCKNDRIRALGYEFIYDHYQEGYQAVINTL